MNVVVSAIVDPWVTTFSFVVALAMRIQDQNKPLSTTKDQLATKWCAIKLCVTEFRTSNKLPPSKNFPAQQKVA